MQWVRVVMMVMGMGLHAVSMFSQSFPETAETVLRANEQLLELSPEEQEAQIEQLFASMQKGKRAVEQEALKSHYTAQPELVAEASVAWSEGQEPPPTIQVGTERWVAYGVEHPVLRCTQARACGVQLEAGEIVHHIQVGDSTHWAVEEGAIGETSNPAPIVYFSPHRADIATNAFISTTRRLYTIGLISPTIDELHTQDQPHYVRLLRFFYKAAQVPVGRSFEEVEEILARRREGREEQTPTVDPRPEALPVRSTDYTWKAKPKKGTPFTPTAVWDDGERVYIQLPERELPMLPAVVVDGGGGESVANHHYDEVNRQLVIHQLVERVDLVVKASGQGSSKKKTYRVRIEKG